MVCWRWPVTSSARSQIVGRSVARINGSSQKSGRSSSGCCLESQSRAQSLKARVALLLLFIRRVAVARARRREASLCRVRSQEWYNFKGAKEVVDLSWSRYFPEGRCRAGSSNVDVMRRAVWLSARLPPSGVDVGSSVVKRERAIGPRERGGRIERAVKFKTAPVSVHSLFALLPTFRSLHVATSFVWGHVYLLYH